MISYVKGKVIEKGADHLTVLMGGLGLEVRAPAGTIDKAPAVGSEFSLYTYLHVRDDALQLYGFDSMRARDLFCKLLSVSGFGAQKALSVLSVFSPEGFENVIQGEDAGALTRIPGIGKKNAERLLLEMKDKIEPVPAGVPPMPEEKLQPFQEAIEALVNLGYTRSEAHGSLKDYPFTEEEVSVEDMLQFALRNADRR